VSTELSVAKKAELQRVQERIEDLERELANLRARAAELSADLDPEPTIAEEVGRFAS
jgi:predicted RNase H-like nuclease (RuvC/YqgF family)